jgi:hypothetical protein
MESMSSLQEILIGEQFSVPLWEVVIFVLINSICLLMGRMKMGLLISYSFIFYWGFILNMNHFSSVLNETTWGMTIYAFAGFLMFLVALISFFIEGRD